MLDMRKTTRPTVYQIIVIQVTLDISDFLANFAILWVLGPQITQNGEWTKSKLVFSSIFSQWLKCIRPSSNSRNSLVSPIRSHRVSQCAIGGRETLSNDVPIMSSHLSIPPLTEEEKLSARNYIKSAFSKEDCVWCLIVIFNTVYLIIITFFFFCTLP
jgi:hypothetical protein